MQKDATFAQAKSLAYPMPVAVAIVRNGRDKYNPVTLGWAMQASHDPPMWAISVAKTHYSLDAIRQAGEFVLAWPSEHQENETLYFGTHSGRDVDKLIEAGTRTRPAAHIASVLLEDAVANFECRVVAECEAGDHVVFVGEILASYVHETPANRLYIVGPGHQVAGIPRQ